MKTDIFDFHLPEERIATHPASPRDSSKLLHIKPMTTSDRIMRDLPSILKNGDVLVFNNTKVIPARLFGRRGIRPSQLKSCDGRMKIEAESPIFRAEGSEMKSWPDNSSSNRPIEILLHQNIDGNKWLVFAKPAKRLRIGDVVEFAAEFSASVLEKRESGEVLLEFICDNLPAMLKKHGHMPLPPYIKRSDSNNDRSDYQTIYAKHDGAVAAPTAGLHFTPELMSALKSSGIEILEVTLHVGAGTFMPVKVDDISEHKMHSEWGEIDAATAAKINAAKAEGRRIVAVGTTSLRLLESAASTNRHSGEGRNPETVAKSDWVPTCVGTTNIAPFHGSTDIFITPGYEFKIVDVLLTNFHLPRSTLFMLVSAFMGLEKMQASYQHAIKYGYRFYSYGDACLLERK